MERDDLASARQTPTVIAQRTHKRITNSRIAYMINFFGGTIAL